MHILLETTRLYITKPSITDLDNYVKLHMDKDVRRLIYTQAKDAVEVKKWLDISIEHQEKCGFTVGCVYEKATHNFIGRAGLLHLNNDPNHPDVEIDCFLLKPYWRKKYATELLQAFFTWGFANFPINKIIATVNPINITAKLLAERVGMHFVGIKEYQGADFLWYEISSSSFITY